MEEITEKPAEMPGLNEKPEDKPKRSKAPIIIIAVVIAVVLLPLIAAIAYLGILDVEVLLPERCTFPVPINCQDYIINEDSVQLVFLNGGGRGMHIRDITAESQAFKPLDTGYGNHKCSLSVSERDQLLRNGEAKTYTLDVSTENGSKCVYHGTNMSKNRYEIEFFYAWEDSPVEHKVSGEIFAARPEQ